MKWLRGHSLSHFFVPGGEITEFRHTWASSGEVET